MVMNRMLITEWTLAKDARDNAMLRGYGVTKGVDYRRPSEAFNLCIVDITGIAIPVHIVAAPGNEMIDALDTMPGVADVFRISETLTCCRFIKLDTFKAINALENVKTYISEDGVMLGAKLVGGKDNDGDAVSKRFASMDNPTAKLANISFTCAPEDVDETTIDGQAFKTFKIEYRNVRLESQRRHAALRHMFDDDALLTRGGAMRLTPANCKEYDEMPSPRNDIVRTWCLDWFCESIGWNYSFASQRSRLGAVYEWTYPRSGAAQGHVVTENLEIAIVNVIGHDGGSLPLCLVSMDQGGHFCAYKDLQTVEFRLPDRLLQCLKH